MLLQRRYPTYIWDGPRVGRANWSCESITYTPSARDQGNFTAWNFGPAIPAGLVPTAAEWWPGEQFPISSPNYVDYWWNATGARYDEFDIEKNIEIETDAAAVAADSGKVGNAIVYLTNSAGGLRAMKTTAKTTGTNIKGIVTYESIGYVFPIGDPESPGVPERLQEDCETPDPVRVGRRQSCRLCAKLLNKYSAQYNLGGHAEVLKLGEDAGLLGSSHIPFMDMDNDKVIALLDKFLKVNNLDGFVNVKSPGKWVWTP